MVKVSEPESHCQPGGLREGTELSMPYQRGYNRPK